MLLHYLEKQKTENCVILLKRWMLFCQHTQKNTFILSLGHSWTTFHSHKQDLGREHATVCYHTFIVYQVCHDVCRCVKSGSCSLSSLKWKVSGQYWWDILTNFNCYQTCCQRQYYLPFSNWTQLMHAPLHGERNSYSCCAKLLASFLLSYGPNRLEMNSVNCKI